MLECIKEIIPALNTNQIYDMLIDELEDIFLGVFAADMLLLQKIHIYFLLEILQQMILISFVLYVCLLKSS